MPCPNPLQAYFRVLPSGKKELKFSNFLGRLFREGRKMPDDSMAVPCGQCMTCRLERSRVTALRCVHEARMAEHSCFITLTYDDEHLAKLCPLTEGGYSLVRKHATDFIKRLRIKFARGWKYTDKFGKEHLVQIKNIRVFGCGEYGDRNGRPHYHFCLFNCFFPDRLHNGGRRDFKYYTSKCLQELWTFGFSTVCDFSFETAAYVARYCVKKITGKLADSHYRGRLPEFPVYPTRGGGLGKPWFDKYGKTDVIPTDSCIARRVKCSVPAYYDRLRSKFDPDGLARAKEVRSFRAKLRIDDNTYLRLLDKERCMKSKVKCLVRNLEK